MGIVGFSIVLLGGLFFYSEGDDGQSDVSVSLVESASATAVVAKADTYVSKSSPSQSYGTQSTMKVRRLDSGSEHFVSYMLFDLRTSTLPNLQGQTANCSGCKVVLRLHLKDENDSEKSSFGYYSKSVRAMPYKGWSENSLTYNSVLYRHPDTGQVLSENVLDLYEYPAIHAFVAKNTGTSSSLQSEYNALITPTGTGDESIIEIDVTDDLKDMIGHQFVLTLESYRDYQGNPIEIYTKEASGKTPPTLLIEHSNIVAENDGFTAATTLTTPETVDKSAITNNPLTGLHGWTTSDAQNPNYVNAVDNYRRFVWDDLEPSQGVYDFSSIQSYIDDLPQGGRFAFRVRMMRENGNDLPGYLSNRTMSCSNSCGSSASNVPDWDDAFLLQRARLFIEALAEEFDGHPKIAWIDLGMFGRYGEWNCACAETVTDTSVLREYVDMFTDNFRNTQMVIRTGSNYAFVYAQSLPPNDAGFVVGSRMDGYGNKQLHATAHYLGDLEGWKSYDQNWKIAPSVGEFFGPYGSSFEVSSAYYQTVLEARSLFVSTIGNGNTVSYNTLTSQQKEDYTDIGRAMGYKYVLNNLSLDRSLEIGSPFRIKTIFSNYGNVPTYENWITKVKFTNTLNASESFTVDLSQAKLKNLLPTYNTVTGVNKPKSFIDNATVPGSITEGTYKVEVMSTQVGRNNMKLYNHDLNASNVLSPTTSDGIYPLGEIIILEDNNMNFPGGEDDPENICGAADINSDGKFTIQDFTNFSKKYKMTCEDTGSYGGCGGVDANNDGIVDIVDFVLFTSRYGESRTCNITQ
jgi:hypothetical protein